MSFKLLFQLSMRNVLRHRRRNFMLLIAIVFAVGGVTVSNTLLRGMQMGVMDSAIENLTGHVKVHAQGYRDDPSIQRSFAVLTDEVHALDAGEVAGWAPRIRVPAVIMSERERRGVELVGIDPAAEHISFLHDAKIDGEMLKGSDDARVIVGVELLEQLETSIGRRLVIITQGADGLNRERGYRIAGTYDADGTSLEKVFVFTGLAKLQSLLDAERVTELSVRLTDEAHREAFKLKMAALYDDQEVRDWQELSPQAAAMYLYSDSIMIIWFFLFMSALLFGLMNTLIASVMERIRELGMLRALGMPKRYVVIQVVLESAVLMGIGVVVGLGLGYLGFLALGDGIDLSAFADGVEMAGFSSVLSPVLELRDMVQVAYLSLIFGFIASLYPAWRATRIKPLDALRQ